MTISLFIFNVQKALFYWLYGFFYLYIFSLLIMADMIGNTFVQLDTESLILQYLWTHEHTNSFTASQNQTKDFNFLLNETNRKQKAQERV